MQMLFLQVHTFLGWACIIRKRMCNFQITNY